MVEGKNKVNELNIEFNNYLNEFKKLSVLEKREEILYSIKELIAFFDQVSNVENISIEYLKSNEILDNKKSDNEGEFLESLLVYIENAKNIIGQYLDKSNN